MILEFERADRVSDALDGVGLAVGEIVARIDAPGFAGARMLGVKDAIEHRIAEIDIAGAHVDLGAQHARAVGKLAGAHAAEEIEIFLDAPPAVRALGAGLRQRAAGQPHFVLGLVVDIGLAGADQMLRPRVELLEIIGGMKEIPAPIEAEPAHVALDGVDIFLRFLGRIGVVETQIAVAAEFLGDAEIQTDRFGVADVQIAVRLRRKTGDDGFVPAGSKVSPNDVADEIVTRFPHRRFRSRHDPIASVRPRRRPRRARIGQIGLRGQARATKPKRVYFHSYLAVLHEPRLGEELERTMSVVTRFAPSPTGFLHIGGARTALFNWLYARGRGGKMLLRIEDTDRERSTQAAIDAILDGLSWLGIDWDGDVVYQFSRAARHREVAEQLLASGHAYRCYASPEELKEMREAARREGRARLYDGRWRDRDPAEAPPDVKPAIRLKAPLTGETVIEDQVQGRVVWQNENLDDLVLLRSDGNPTYMLAVVVDDHDMAVTHIIRGDDHLTNAARQKQIYDALGWPVPVMSHIPSDPWPRRIEAFQAARRARRRRLPRHGLLAGGVAELPGAARLESRRPGNFLHRGNDHGLRPAADRPLTGAV